MKTSRMYLLCLVIPLLSCGWDGGSDNSAIQHVPEITGVVLTPSQAMALEGDGSVTVTVEVGYTDSGGDIETLRVSMPDGTTLEFAETATTQQGTLTEQISVSTATIGVSEIGFWLEDRAGARSATMWGKFGVVGVLDTGEWTNRLSGLPYALNDVAWNGDVFVAVGDAGAVLTSADGIGWVVGQAPTDADLTALTVVGTEIFAVGSDDTVLLSVDDGQTWTTVNGREMFTTFTAVAVNPPQIVAGGHSYAMGFPIGVILVSGDGGATWEYADLASFTDPATFTYMRSVTDIELHGGIFVAAFDPVTGSPQVGVSVDGWSWEAVTLPDETAVPRVLVRDAAQFIAAGNDGAVFVSADAYNWARLATPVSDVDYLSAAWNGTKLIVAGGIPEDYWTDGSQPDFQRPAGISSTDGGATWAVVEIDGYFQSRGLAWGNGRFVSVGQSTPVSGAGAIYTSD